MISAFCSPPARDTFAARLLTDTDCQAFGLVERGYAALAQPGGTVSTALTGLLILAVAFFGYRLLLGRGLALSDAVALTIKIGIVLMIATSWQSWQALAYDGLARAPTQVAGEMLTGIGAPSPLDSLDRSLDELTGATVGYRMRAGIASPLVGGPAAAAAALNISSVLLTLSIVGTLVVFRVVLAVLLAIAPAMAGLLLFNGTRKMAQGWLGAMAVAALAPLFVLVVAAIEFAILEPMIGRLLAGQAAGQFETQSVMPIALVTLVFAVAIFVAVRAGSRIGFGIRLSRFGRRTVAPVAVGTVQPMQSEDRTLRIAGPTAAPRASRALEAIARREKWAEAATPSVTLATRSSGSARPSGGVAPVSDRGNEIAVPWQRLSRQARTGSRTSRAARRRDG